MIHKVAEEGNPSILDTDSEFSASDIHQQVGRILSSQDFHASKAQQAFLQFVVDHYLSGETDKLRGYTIATIVFGRREDFDQATDPIVSIHANKLRRALERYYLTSGINDPIHIQIPKGTYIPQFTRSYRAGVELPVKVQPGKKTEKEAFKSGDWPTILVAPFENHTGDPKMAYLGVGIANEIALEITRYQEVRMLWQGAQERKIGPDNAPCTRFLLEGCIKKDHNVLKVLVNLIDREKSQYIWGDSLKTAFNPNELISFEERVAHTVVSQLSCEEGIFTKTLLPEITRKAPDELSTYQALLLYYHFQNKFSIETYMEAYRALRQVCNSAQSCGLAWSMLARVYSVNYSLELLELETPLDEADAFAQKGVLLDPANQRVRMIKAYIHLLKDELSEGVNEIEYALQLSPGTLISQENVGYLLTLLGDWQRGPTLIQNAIEQNPYYDSITRHALWVNWIRQGEYEQAYNESQHFRTPTLFWEPLMKASVLGLLGRVDEGVQAAEELLKCKPDFAVQGRRLIRYYIKFDDIVDRMVRGLKAVQIDVQ
ncbi:MAG: hypothetical protein D6B25_11405 [Desulfobulbaceae bacterium]|nr:MAG: hypothetical protein D6B25_11405 [Desulfobulbaceae bacterium]